MSNRQEQKEQRRLEREAAEQQAAASAARRKRLGIVLGGVLVAAVAVVIALAAFSGDDANTDSGDASVPTQGNDGNLAEAARAASCEVEETPSEGRGHTSDAVRYRTNPPTSGSHDPVAAQDGVYPAGGPPDLEQSVHALEHGRINVQYKKGTPAPRVTQLESLVNTFEVKGQAGYHGLAFENQTTMQPAVAATAWTKSLTCAQMNDRVFDAIRAFWRDNVDKGPEFIP